MRSLLLLSLVFVAPCIAQVPRVLTIQMYLEAGGIPLSGVHSLMVRWFNDPVAGLPLHAEDVEADVVDGIATIHVGSNVPLPADLLRKGPLWLAISVDGGPELVPRTMLASVPYALLTERALVAEALAPEVTGVVTSINEIAGAVDIVGSQGIHISRAGRRLTISARSAIAHGTIRGQPGIHRYTVTLPEPLPSQVHIAAAVIADTFVGVSVEGLDVATGSFTLITSAPLLDSESIEWAIY